MYGLNWMGRKRDEEVWRRLCVREKMSGANGKRLTERLYKPKMEGRRYKGRHCTM